MPIRMGQTVSVVEKPSGYPQLRRFELNHALTGMGHERYRRGDVVDGQRPPDVLARRLLELEGVAAVHIYANQVTLELDPFGAPVGVIEVIRGLYTHYLEGVEPKRF